MLFLTLRLAWRNIWRNKRRTFITMGSIVMAVLLASIMASMQQGQYAQMIDNTVGSFSGHLQVQDPAYFDESNLDHTLIPDSSLITLLNHHPGVKAFVPRIESYGLAAGPHKTKAGMIIGIDIEAEEALSKPREKLMSGSYFESNADPSVLLASGLADYLELGINDTLILISQGYHGQSAANLFPVKGLLKFGIPQMNNGLLYLPLETAQTFFGATNRLTAIAVMTHNPKQTEEIVDQLNREVDTGQYSILGWQTLMPELVQAIQADWGSGLVILMILYMVVGFGILGTVLMMTAERKFEFGVMIAIGTARWKMILIVILEMLFITSLGTLIGFLFSFPVIYYFNQNPIYFTGEMAAVIEEYGMEPFMRFSTDPMVLSIQAQTVFIIALIISIYPLWHMNRLDPVKSMRR